MNKNDGLKKVQTRYGCGPVQIHGSDDALYDRHLLFLFNNALVGVYWRVCLE